MASTETMQESSGRTSSSRTSSQETMQQSAAASLIAAATRDWQQRKRLAEPHGQTGPADCAQRAPPSVMYG